MIKASTLVTLLTAALAVTACSSKKKDAPPATPPKTEVKPAPTPPAPTPPAPTPPAPTPPGAGMIEIKDVGFATPESVLYLPDQDLYLVSNINGAPTAVDDNGFISKLDADGKVIDLKWIDGAKDTIKLDAPKGMAVLGGKLYVADVTSVRVFDLATGAATSSIDIPGTTFLNDVAAATDKIYVTDSGLTAELKPSGTDAVYAIDGAGKATAIATGADLKGPNGVTVVGGLVWIAPFGSNEVYKVVDGKKVEPAALPTGGLDGLEALADGRIVVSSWEGKAIYIGAPAGPFTKLADGVEAPADLGVDRKRNRVMVPMFMANAVRFYPIP
jgi:hypothetical protein